MSDGPDAETLKAIEQLVEHGAGASDGCGSGFADVVRRFEHGGGTLVLGEVWMDIAQALQQLTHRAITPDHQRRVAYAIAEVIASATRRPLAGLPDDVRLEFDSFVWRVACAWEAFLAGDVGDLIEHVGLEARATGLPTWP